MVNYSQIIMRAARLMKRSSVIDPPPAGCPNEAPDGIITEQILAVAERVFRDASRVFVMYLNFRPYNGGWRVTREGQAIRAHRPRPLGAPCCLVPPSCDLWSSPEATWSYFGPKKS